MLGGEKGERGGRIVEIRQVENAGLPVRSLSICGRCRRRRRRRRRRSCCLLSGNTENEIPRYFRDIAIAIGLRRARERRGKFKSVSPLRTYVERIPAMIIGRIVIVIVIAIVRCFRLFN